MICLEMVEVKWIGKTKKWYVDKGYNYTKLGDLFMVLPTDLTKGSHVKVKTSCNYCNEIVYKAYKNYLRETENGILKNSCKNCNRNKAKDTWLELYGVDNPNKSQEIKVKKRETNLERYGVEFIMQSPEMLEKQRHTVKEKYGKDNISQVKEIHQKKINTNINKYGTEYYFQTEVFKEDSKSSMLERYGVENYTSTDKYLETNKLYWEKIREDGTIEKIVEKRESTNLNKYGFKNPMQHPEVQKKAFQSFFVNGTAPSSKEQRRICELVEGELNYPSHPYMLDIAFPKEMIYIEYDGGGHDLLVKNKTLTKAEFAKKEEKRSKTLFSRNWKEVRIINLKDKKMKSEDILDFITMSKEYFTKSSNNFISWDIESNEISYSKNYDILEESCI